jgi:hypothetical protein
MLNAGNRHSRRPLGVAAMVALAGLLAAARPAAAQYLIGPDRSTVILPRKPPLILNSSLVVTPVVVQGQYVRVSATYSGTTINPSVGYPGTGFLQPTSANDRARGANFYGTPPGRIYTAPFRPWW